MPRFRKKPVVVEAFRFGHDRPPLWWKEAVDGGVACCTDGGSAAAVRTLEGVMHANRGDWIIRGVEGEVYPCKPSVFDATYEPVE